MLIFNCTQAASDFFSSKVKGNTVSPVQPASAVEDLERGNTLSDPIDRWQLHHTNFGRTHILLAVQVETRFAMLFVGLKRNDMKGFLKAFHDRHQVEMLLWVRLTQLELPSPEEMQKYLDQWGEQFRQAHFFKHSDRSVQTHINQILGQAAYEAYEGEGLPVEMSDLMEFDRITNSQLRKIGSKGDDFYPAHMMLQKVYPLLGGRMSEQQVEAAYREYSRNR